MVLSYFLQLHLLVHETNHEKIVIPKGVIPELPPPPSEKELAEFPHLGELHRLGQRLHREFMANNPKMK